MIMIKDLTPIVKYEAVKLENHFHEMLAATVSHEMRTPLNIILGVLSALAKHITSEEGMRLHRIVTSSSHMLVYLVNDLLDLFQIKNSKFQKKERPINIKKSI